MKIIHIFKIVAALFIITAVTPVVGFAHESVDPLHATPVETVDSHLATPTNIHVQITDNSVEVSGILKRHLINKRQRLRGHIDVELLNAEGQVIENIMLSVKRRPGPARHDHKRKFYATLPVPSSKDYTVSVRHSITMDDHK